MSALTLAALALLGFVLAYWTWTWFAPRSELRVAAAAQPRVQIASAKTLFGNVQPDQSAGASPTGIAVKLLGVVAASAGRRGHVIVQLDGKETRVAREQDEIAPGIRVAAVHPDHVVLERNGMRETLTWPKKIPASESAASRSKK